jgi:hypothetical protein
MRTVESSSSRKSRLLIAGLLLALLGPIVPTFFLLGAAGQTAPTTLQGRMVVSAPPAGDKGPDDIALLTTPGLDNGMPMIWTAYQNGINADGTPGSPGGPTQSTVAGYDALTGALVTTIQVTGKSDGLSSDQSTGMLISTINEDSNSHLDLINPATGAVTTYAYNPNPAVSGNGGTDSIAVIAGRLYLAHSNPNDTSQAAVYGVTLDAASLTANLTPVFYCNGMATNIETGATFQMALTDPDTNFVMPSNSPNFPGALAQISQADGLVVFDSPSLTGPTQLHVLNLTDNKPGNVPPVDGFAVATSGSGTLYVVDAKAGTIQAFDTTGFPTGTIFIGEPNDNSNPLVGTLNPFTGKITPFTNTFASPKGLLFVPSSALSVVTTTSTATMTETTTQVSTQTSVSTSMVDTSGSSAGLLYGVIAVLVIIVLALGYAAARKRSPSSQ